MHHNSNTQLLFFKYDPVVINRCWLIISCLNMSYTVIGRQLFKLMDIRVKLCMLFQIGCVCMTCQAKYNLLSHTDHLSQPSSLPKCLAPRYMFLISEDKTEQHLASATIR